MIPSYPLEKVLKGILINPRCINIICLFLFGIMLMNFSNSLGQTYCFTAPQGYGAATTGGGNATPTTVTTYAALQSALTASSAGVILVSGTIDFSSSGVMKIVVKNKTLIGLPGAKLKNTNQSSSGILWLNTGSTNVIIRNLIFEGPGAWDNNGNDNLTVKSCTNLWVDHCEFQDGEDGNFDNSAVTDNVTVTWCKFTYLKTPRPAGSGTTDDHRFTNLVGGSDSDMPADGKYSITWQYCWWAEGCVERMTRARNAQLNMVSCYWNSSVANVDLGLGGVTDCYVENSVFASTGLSYKYYSNGTVRLTSVGCTSPPANVGTCPVPSYTRESISAASVVSALTGPCGAGATLNVTAGGVVSANSACSTTPTLVLTSGTASQSVSAGTAITSIVYTWGGNATDVTISGLPAGLTSTKNTGAKTITISGTPTANGTYTVTTVQPAGTAVALSGTITVVPLVAPTLVLTSGSATQSFVLTTALSNIVYTWGGGATDVTVSGLPAGVTATKNSTAKTVTLSGTPTAAGTYNFSLVTVGGSAPMVTLTGTITVTTPVVLNTPGNITATSTGTTVTIDWDPVTNATGYVVNWCSVPSGGTPTDVTAALNNNTYSGGYYTLSSGDKMYTVTGNSASTTGPCAPGTYRTTSANDFSLELVSTASASAIRIGGRSSGTTSNRNLLSYSINGGAAQTAGISGLITAQNCTTEITISGLSLNAGDKIAFTFDNNVQLSYFIITTAGAATPTCTQYTVSGGSNTIYTVSGLTTSTTYSYQVKATNGTSAETSSYSSATNISTTAGGNASPVVSITAPATNYCATVGATVTLTANATDADGTVSNVQFYDGATLLGAGTKSGNDYSYSWASVAAGTHTITAVATDNQTASTTSTAITVKVSPAVSITGLGAGVINCTTTSITLGSSQTASSYAWTRNSVATGTSSTLSVTTAGTYGLTVTYANGCTATASTVATTVDNAAPAVSITGLGGGVINCTTTSITLGSSQTASSYAWTRNSVATGTGSTLSVTTAGTYGLTVTYANGCTAIASTVATTVNTTAPAVSITGLGAGVINCTTTSITLGSSQTASSYAWTRNSVGVGTGSTLSVTTAGTYGLTVTYANGCTATASTVATTVNNTAPTATITPNGPTTFTTGGNVILNANTGSGLTYQWYNNASLISGSTGASYTATTGGNYTVEVTNSSTCKTTSSAVTVIVNPPGNQAPAVSIISPADNASFIAPAAVTINVNASDPDGTITKVEFYEGGNLLSTDNGSPYSFTWSGVTAGTYLITARAFDNSGASTVSSGITINVSANQPSVITITSPTNGGTVSGTGVTISISASDPDGGISKVEYYDGAVLLGSDTNAPYDFTWTNPGPGSHVITVKVTDSNGGETTSAPINITVSSATAILPSVSYGAFTNVYPNPSSETFKVTCNEKVSYILVINCYGEQVGKLEQIDAGKQVEIGEELPQGMYMLVVEYASNKREVAKIVKLK